MIQPTVQMRYHFIWGHRSIFTICVNFCTEHFSVDWICMASGHCAILNLLLPAIDTRTNGLIWFAHAGMYHINNRCYVEMFRRPFAIKYLIVILNAHAHQLQTTHANDVRVFRKLSKIQHGRWNGMIQIEYHIKRYQLKTVKYRKFFGYFCHGNIVLSDPFLSVRCQTPLETRTNGRMGFATSQCTFEFSKSLNFFERFKSIDKRIAM